MHDFKCCSVGDFTPWGIEHLKRSGKAHAIQDRGGFDLKYTLNLSSAEIAARLKAVYSGYYDSLLQEKGIQQKIHGTVERMPDRTFFTMKMNDERFLFARIPRIFLKGEIEDAGAQSVVHISFSFSVWVYIMYVVIGLVSVIIFAQYDVQTAVSFLICVLLLIAVTIVYNVSQREKLVQAFNSVFRDDH